MSRPLHKILVIHTAGGIGDVLLSTAVVSALRRAYPDSQLDFLCPSRTAVALLHPPEIHELFVWPCPRPDGLLHWAMLLLSLIHI